MEKEYIQHFQRNLLDWYEAHARILPWRENPTPFRVWVSEIMLQQTRVDTVMPYFDRFIRAIPTIQSLATVPEDRLMKLWQGLGYYRRAKHLKEAAQEIVTKHQGLIPRTADELIQIKGIGKYTAGAIASIAFNQPVIAVDGNVMRVISRVIENFSPIDDGKTQKLIEDFVEEILSRDRPGDFNQALMELGAKICTPTKDPKCLECPLRKVCRAYHNQTQSSIPVKRKKLVRTVEQRTIVVLEYKNQIAIQKRPASGLLANLYEPINLSGHHNQQVVAHLLGLCEQSIESMDCLDPKKHIFSHIEWEMVGYHIKIKDLLSGFTFVSKSDLQSNYSIPTAFQYYIQWALADYSMHS